MLHWLQVLAFFKTFLFLFNKIVKLFSSFDPFLPFLSILPLSYLTILWLLLFCLIVCLFLFVWFLSGFCLVVLLLSGNFISDFFCLMVCFCLIVWFFWLVCVTVRVEWWRSLQISSRSRSRALEIIFNEYIKPTALKGLILHNFLPRCSTIKHCLSLVEEQQ